MSDQTHLSPTVAGEAQLPPPLPDLARYWIAVTTPYVLTEASKADWTQFLRRGSQAGSGNCRYHFHSAGACFCIPAGQSSSGSQARRMYDPSRSRDAFHC